MEIGKGTMKMTQGNAKGRGASAGTNFSAGLSDEEAQRRERLERAMEILDTADRYRIRPEAEPMPLKPTLSVDEICRRAGEHVVGRQKELRVLAEYFAMWAQRRELLLKGVDREDLPTCKSLFIAGPTASSKTYLVRTVCKVMGYRYVPTSLASLTGTGWRGVSVGDILAEAASWQVEHPGQVQVLFWDEADKHRVNEQREGGITFNPACDLLKVLDAETGTYNATGTGDASPKAGLLNLDDCVFVFAGAFSDIEELVVRPRLRRQAKSGYGLLANDSARDVARLDADDLRRELQPEDLVEWGILAELCGRSGYLLSLTALSEDELRRIVNDSPHSLERRNNLLMREGVKLSIDDQAALGLARRARSSSLGARMLDNLLQPAVAHAMTVSADCPEVAYIRIVWDEEAQCPQCVFANAHGRVLEVA